MNKDDVLRMAQECQLIGMRPHLDGIYQESLERFAALVAAAEREACAKLCRDRAEDAPEAHAAEAWLCSAAIRARGQA